MVATIACVGAWLTSIGWSGFGLSESLWTIVLIVIACFLYLRLIQKPNMGESAAVGIWAFIGIAIRQRNDHKDIVFAALAAALILIISSSLHLYKNWSYNIVAKLKRGEW